MVDHHNGVLRRLAAGDVSDKAEQRKLKQIQTERARQREEMLGDLGLTMDDLFADIPADLRCRSFDIPEGISEQEVRRRQAQETEG